jgi:hypothetical protein
MVASYPKRPQVSKPLVGKDTAMVYRWLFRFVALFLGRKAWEAFQRRRQEPAYSGTAGGPSRTRRTRRSTGRRVSG